MNQLGDWVVNKFDLEAEAAEVTKAQELKSLKRQSKPLLTQNQIFIGFLLCPWS